MNRAVTTLHTTDSTTPPSLLELDEALERQRSGIPVWQWFDRRIRTHHDAIAALGGTRLRKDEVNRRIHKRLANPGSGRPRVMYLHIPFCRRICSFCAFFRKPTNGETEGYANAMLRQIQAAADTPWAQYSPFQAIYFGGGTPTVLTADRLAELVLTARERLPLTPLCEITVETCFEGIDRSYLSQLYDVGVNRLSFGLQTFNTAIRQKLGRRMDLPAILQVIKTADSIGFQSLCVDLIYNLPGQTESSWLEDLQILQTSPVTGASVYALIPYSGSAMMRAIEAGNHSPLGGPEREYRLFDLANQALSTRSGWRRMTPFHYGDFARETCTYNRSRSGGTDILGLGCGAGGSLDSVGYMHEMDITGYCNGSNQHAVVPAIAGSERHAEILPRLAALELLDEEGIEEDRLYSLVPKSNSITDRSIELELIERTGSRVRLTSDGCFWAYTITSFFAEAIARTTAKQSN